DQWQHLGEGLASPIVAATEHEGSLVVATASRVYLRENGAWRELPAPPVDLIRAIASFQGRVVAADAYARSLWAWNGTEWTSFGPTLAWVAASRINTISVVESKLVVAGLLPVANGWPSANICAFDGVGWRAIGAGLNGEVTGLGSFNGQIVAG